MKHETIENTLLTAVVRAIMHDIDVGTIDPPFDELTVASDHTSASSWDRREEMCSGTLWNDTTNSIRALISEDKEPASPDHFVHRIEITVAAYLHYCQKHGPPVDGKRFLVLAAYALRDEIDQAASGHEPRIAPHLIPRWKAVSAGLTALDATGISTGPIATCGIVAGMSPTMILSVLQVGSRMPRQHLHYAIEDLRARLHQTKDM